MAGAKKSGAEFRVNTATAGDQAHSSVVALAGGGFTVLFTSPHVDGGTFGANDVFARSYGANYTALGNPFGIAVDASFSDAPSGAAFGLGFVAAWDAPFGASASAIVSQPYEASGSALAPVTLVSGTTGAAHAPQLAASSLGAWIVAWADSGQSLVDTKGSAILARIGGAGPLLTVNATTKGEQTSVAAAGLDDLAGSFVLAWRSDPLSTQVAIKAQIVSAAGLNLGGEISVADDIGTGGDQIAITATPGGGFMVSWVEDFALKARFYGADGAALTGILDLAPEALDGIANPAAAALSNRLTAVVYQGLNDAQAMFVKTFAPDGTEIGPRIAFAANGGALAASDLVGHASVAALSGGDFVVTWTDTAAGREAGGAAGTAAVMGQVYNSAAPAFIDGTAANDVFNGAAATGFFLGYGGFDTVSYAAASAGVVADLGGIATNAGAAAGDGFGISVERLIGSAFADRLSGNALANTLQGGAGVDTLKGGDGDDIYVDPAGDVIVESAGQGIDTVQSSAGYALGNNLERLILTGTADSDGAGNALDNQIYGNAGANVLNGGTGADTLSGGAGDDTYLNPLGDLVIEGAAGGFDTVQSNATIALAANVEHLVLTGLAALDGTGNAGDNLLDGNAAANLLDGLAGNDTLNGFGGNDTLDGGAGLDSLLGGAGNDTYVNPGSDAIVELAGQGTDTILSSGAYNLAAAPGVERLTLTGSNAGNGLGNALANIVTGNDGNNRLTGEDGNDTLNGGGGMDTLEGGAGDDRMNGGAGADFFRFGLATGNDTITGFSQADDAFDLSGNGKFSELVVSGGDTILTHAGGTVTVVGVTGLSLHDWNQNFTHAQPAAPELMRLAALALPDDEPEHATLAAFADPQPHISALALVPLDHFAF